MRVHQVLVGAGPGDAVTQIATQIRRAVGSVVGAEIFAVHRDPATEDVAHINELPPPRSSRDVIIYHLSIGEPLLADMLVHRPERLVIHYHNITPPGFFAERDPAFAAKLLSGRDEMRVLAARADAVVADSAFNAGEIQPFSSVPVVVMPPPLPFDRFARMEPHGPTDHHLRTAVARPIVLVLGQLLPHKRPDIALGTAYVLAAHVGVDAQFVLAGAPRDAAFAAQLHQHQRRLGLPNVWIAGRLAEDELAAVLRNAAVLLVPSAHEGFCVPIAEAFHLGLPVVASAAGAIPETLGDGGMLLPQSAGPELFAEAVGRIVTDEALHRHMSDRARSNAARFGPGSLRILVDVLTELAS